MYQLVIVDDEDKIVEGIANLFPFCNHPLYLLLIDMVGLKA